jgi:Ras GTPase-activating-like protein IQGAP2/3
LFEADLISHLLAKLGKAERIGNLVGQFDFTDEQLAMTQKGLQGVAMPNFGDAKATLAKEASWAPEEPEETEDESELFGIVRPLPIN